MGCALVSGWASRSDLPMVLVAMCGLFCTQGASMLFCDMSLLLSIMFVSALTDACHLRNRDHRKFLNLFYDSNSFPLVHP